MRREFRAAADALVRGTLTAISAPVLSRRFQQAAATAHEPVKVNIGAGEARLAGWINTDISWRSGIYLDITRPWPVPPGSIDRIYGDNVIEHFPLGVCRTVLRRDPARS